MIKVALGIVPYNGDSMEMIRYFVSLGEDLYSENQYVPIFHFMRDVDIKLLKSIPYLTEYIARKEEQFDKKIEAIKPPHDFPIDSSCSLEDMRKLVDESRSYAKPLMVTYLLSHDMISGKQATEWLASVYESDAEVRGHTNLKCAVTYVGFRNFIEKYKGEQ